MKMFNLRGKVIVISGGCGLIGREFVRAVVRNKGVAIIADTDVAAGNRFCDELAQERLGGGDAAFYQVDITGAESIKELIDGLDERYGKIDALVNNAYPRNRNYGRHFYEVEYEDFCDNVGMHVGGYFLMAQKLGAYFEHQGNGNIINIGSVYGVIPPRFEIYDGTDMTTPAEYAVIKSGIIHLTKYLAKYFKNKNIRVNAISPGGVLDAQPEPFLRKYRDLCSSKGMLDPSDLIGTLLYLLSDGSSCVNGQNMIVDDGFCL